MGLNRNTLTIFAYGAIDKLNKVRGLIQKELPGTNFEEAKELTQYDYANSFAEASSEWLSEAKSKREFYQNKLDYYDLMERIISEILPKRVVDMVGMFTEIESVKDGEKAMFTTLKGKLRGKGFITQVGTAGTFETFRLDVESYMVDTRCHGGAARIDLTHIARGDYSLQDLLDIILEGLEDSIYKEIWTALLNIQASLPTNNVATSPTFVAAGASKVINTIRKYSSSVYIFCFEEFAQQIREEADYVSARDKDEIRDKGHIGRWRGAEIIVMPNSFVDTTNNETVFPVSKAIVLGARQKVVKLAFEGDVEVSDYTNRDRSVEVSAERKFGVAIHHMNDIGIIHCTDLD